MHKVETNETIVNYKGEFPTRVISMVFQLFFKQTN